MRVADWLTFEATRLQVSHLVGEHVATLRLAKGLRELGLPLSDVAPILLVAHDGTCREVRESMTRTFTRALGDLEARIHELERVRDHLASLCGDSGE